VSGSSMDTMLEVTFLLETWTWQIENIFVSVNIHDKLIYLYYLHLCLFTKQYQKAKTHK